MICSNGCNRNIVNYSKDFREVENSFFFFLKQQLFFTVSNHLSLGWNFQGREKPHEISVPLSSDGLSHRRLLASQGADYNESLSQLLVLLFFNLQEKQSLCVWLF